MIRLIKTLIQYSGFAVILLFMLVSCGEKSSPLFTKMPASETGIEFINHNTDSDSLSIMDYLYYYNGAGVGAADFPKGERSVAVGKSEYLARRMGQSCRCAENAAARRAAG